MWVFEDILKDTEKGFTFTISNSDRGDCFGIGIDHHTIVPFRYVMAGSVRIIDIDNNILGEYQKGDIIPKDLDYKENINILVTLEDGTRIFHAYDPNLEDDIQGFIHTKTTGGVYLRENDRIVALSGLVGVDGKELEFRRSYRISSGRESDIEMLGDDSCLAVLVKNG